ncbi:hypothetical protein [Streptomyces sp. 3213.3]|uniref:hypothetical protein n=1 Tax=Streptomyces sp. 3213.3 TaxID=1855348 RepID=UPI000B852FAC|nr:hypothetical protein [Streptomyces sp. 3213.3]
MDLSAAVAQTRDELGTDVYVFVEGEQRDFLGDPFTLGIAAWIVSTFLNGFTAVAQGEVEGWGERAFGWLRDGVTGRRKAELETDAAAAQAAVTGRMPEDIEAFARASDAALRAALDEYGLDWVAVERVAAKAREAGLEAIGV